MEETKKSYETPEIRFFSPEEDIVTTSTGKLSAGGCDDTTHWSPLY